MTTTPKLALPPGVYLEDVIYAHNLLVDIVNGATSRHLADSQLDGVGGIAGLSQSFDEWISHYHRMAVMPAGGDPAPPAAGLITLSPETHSFDLDGHPISIYVRNDHATNNYTLQLGGTLASLTPVAVSLDVGEDYFIQYVHTAGGPVKLLEQVAA